MNHQCMCKSSNEAMQIYDQELRGSPMLSMHICENSTGILYISLPPECIYLLLL
jgi:hypothetical protein